MSNGGNSADVLSTKAITSPLAVKLTVFVYRLQRPVSSQYKVLPYPYRVWGACFDFLFIFSASAAGAVKTYTAGGGKIEPKWYMA